MSSHKIALEQDVVVTQLKGNIYLVAADGSQKQLAEGDILPRDAVLITPEGASFNGGNQTFTLSPTNEQQAEDETSQAPLLAQNQDVATGTPDEISALQQAILGGADPTQAFEAAAAGGAPAAGGGNIGGVAGASGNGGFVTIDRTGDATIAAAGFDTANQTDAGVTGDAVAGEDDPFDLVPPVITVSAPDNTNDTTPTLTGTTDAPAGSTVTLLVTDANGNQQTLTTTVNPDGTFSVDVVTPLVDGAYTVTANVTDPAGNTASATDDGSVDSTAPSAPLVEIQDGADNVISANERENGVDVIIRLPADAKVGDRLDVDWNGDGVPDSSSILTADDISKTLVTLTIPTTDLPVNGPVIVDATLTDPVGNTSPKGTDNSVVNAAPLPSDDQFTVTEDGTVTVNVLGNDTDADSDRLTVTAINGQAIAEGGTVAISNGSVTLSNGQLIFTPAPNFNGNIAFGYTITDGLNSATGGVIGTVTSVNDAAVVSSANVTLTETDAPLVTGGTLTATDVDNPDNTFTPITVLGQYGEFTLAANGVWSFTANSAFNELNVGDQLSESFAVTSVDGTPSSVTVTITGSNDAAVVSSANVTLTETDAPLVTGGTLTATDVDNPDNTFTPITVVGQYGEFTLAANGVWSFTANSAFNELNVGDQLSESFAVTSVDGTPSSVTVTITGSNDAAVVSSANVTLTETDAPLVTGGTLTATDVDNPDNTFTPITVVGQYGEFTLAANGVWSFTANSAFNELNVGDQLSESFAVTSVDGTPSSVTVTITGSNDAAVVSSANVTLTETDAPLVTGGTLTATDVDNPDNTFTPITVLGQYGEFTLAANGVWSFTANSAFNELNVGDQLSESFAVTSVDGTPSSVTVTITGSNDAAVVSSANVTLTETDAPLVTGGTLTATDVDNPDNTFTPITVLGQYGEFTLAANGVWSFTANSAFNELNVGDQLSESFAVTSVDGTPSSVTVTITGSNDAAVVSSANVTLTETDAPLVTGGTLTATDVDNPDNTFTPITVLGQYGEFTLAANGVWSFTANSAFNELNVGDQLSESFAVTSVDGTPSSVTVTITGSNDAAVVSSANVTLTETDAPLVTGGTLTATDVDNPDNTFTPITVVGQYGEFTLAANGVWSFTANSAFNELNVGDQLSESFAVISVDGTPSSVTVTITGSNDAAVVSSANVTLTETDAPLVTGGTLTATDVDNPDNTFTPITVVGQYGEFTLAANGVWSFTANSAFNELNVGDQLSESFAVTSVDGTPSSVTVTITGSNDAAVVSSANVTLTETDAPLVIGGTLTATDVDNPDNTFTPITVVGQYGEFTLAANGVWSFTANSAFNELNVGDQLSESFAVTSVDGTPSSVTVTITGSNDAAVVSSANVTLTETDAPLVTGGTLTATDVDNPDNTFTPITVLGQYGEFTLAANGVWSFTANSAFNELNVGDQLSESFAVTSVDGTPSSVTVTITGSNDAAVVSSANVTLTETDAPLVTGGTLTATDVDNPDNTFPDHRAGPVRRVHPGGQRRVELHRQQRVQRAERG
ncbi:beta strand repeat-containing protein [Aeromonas salmonicida]|uniref:beta strand repeat-containing protein n=1 Tax=Aeromonas salmonicida TaxID=645 RepID=UPI00145BE6A3|nr:retention module-containing protein [Aeromonas salmonicida]